LDGASFSNSGLSNFGLSKLLFQSVFVVASWKEQEQDDESFVVFEDVVIVVVLDSVERDDSAAAESAVGVVDFVNLSSAAADSENHFATILVADTLGVVCVAVGVSYAAGAVAVVA